MKILLINIDSRWNMAIRKMYTYYSKDNEVDMIDLNFSGYPHKKQKTIDAGNYFRFLLVTFLRLIRTG